MSTRRTARNLLSFRHRGKSSERAPSPNVSKYDPGVNTQASDEGKARFEKSQPSTISKSGAAEDSLWTLAYHDLRRDNPKLVQQLQDCLGVRNTHDGAGDLISSDINRVVQGALEEIAEAADSVEHSRTALAIRKLPKKAVTIVIASKDFIAAAASANPHAALAWSGVSLLLPLLLNPSQEDEAAKKGLDYIVVLMAVYEWQEKTYLHHDRSSPDLKTLVIRLYTLILEFEATLLIYFRKNALKQYAQAVFHAGGWSGQIKDIQELDGHCRAITNAIADAWTVEWRSEEREWQYALLQQPRQEEEDRHIKMLYTNYEQGKNANPERIPGTCEWFLSHVSFLTWRKSRRSGLLWLSADPGCGKSVLSKALVDRRGEVLTVNPEPPTVCYFFFKDGDINRMDAANALRAILHQLIMQNPRLYSYAREDFRKKNEQFLTDFDALWTIFMRAAEDPSNREIVCVLDALDECEERSRTILIGKLVQLFQFRHLDDSGKPILKFLVASRPHYSIIREFKPLTNSLSKIRLRGEEESEQISREIDVVIRHKVKELGAKMDLHKSDQLDLQNNLTSIPHRTYLWLHLTFDNIAKRLELFKEDIAAIAKTIPENVDEAYTAILDKSPDKQRARKLLHIILAATRPLTLREVNVAMEIKERPGYYQDIDVWEPEIAVDRIKNMCSLFVSVVDSEVYLIHQTAREFLVREELDDSLSQRHNNAVVGWKHSFHIAEANLVMAKSCIWYLQLRDFEELEKMTDRDEFLQLKENYPFLFYAVKYWAVHFTQAGDAPEAALVATVAFTICNPFSSALKALLEVYRFQPSLSVRLPLCFTTNLSAASCFGLSTVVKLLLEQGDVEINSIGIDGRTPLSYAAENGFEAVVELLLAREDIQTNLEDFDGVPPLSYAITSRNEAGVRLLLAREDLQTNVRDKHGDTPLSLAINIGEKEIIRLLLAREDLQTNLRDNHGRTPLSYAAEMGDNDVVSILLANEGVQTVLRDDDGRTPLSYAIENGDEATVQLLLAREDADRLKREQQ
ncbi:MAG: hypothetical protein Q9225_007244 [Loekoesia sp. 1 TL-2023]